MKYLWLLLLYAPLKLSTAATVSSTPARYKRRRSNGRVRGSSVRRLDVHSNIFADEARSTGLTINARGMIMAKHQSGKGKDGGGKDESSGDVLNLPMKSGDVLNLPMKTSLLKKLGMGKQQKDGYSSSSSLDDDESTRSKGKEKGSGMDTAQSSMPRPSSSTTKSPAKESSGKYSKSSKIPQGLPSMRPKSTSAPSQTPKGMGMGGQMNQSPTSNGMGMGGSNGKTPNPTQHPTPPLTHMPSIGKYPKESHSSSSSSKDQKGMMMGMKMGSDKSAYPPTHPPVEQTPSPTAPMSCMVNSAGNAGSMTGEMTIYNFFYELEVAQEVSAEELDDILLKEVEVATTNALIPSLFPNQCGGGRRLQDTESGGRYVGISTRPPDFALNGFSCTGDFTQPCYLISGATAVFSEGLSEESIREELSTDLLIIMQSGLLTDMFDEIVGTTLLDSNLNPATAAPTIVPLPQPTVSASPATGPAQPSIQPPSTQTIAPSVSPRPSLVPTVSSSPTSSPRPTSSASPTRIPTVATPGPTVSASAPSNEPEDGDGGTPFLPLWAWITLPIGVAILLLICFYLNRSQKLFALDTEAENLTSSQYNNGKSQAFSDSGENYVPPTGNLQSTPNESNRYLQSSATSGQVRAGTVSDSEADAGGNDTFVPPNIRLDPNAEGGTMDSPEDSRTESVRLETLSEDDDDQYSDDDGDDDEGGEDGYGDYDGDDDVDDPEEGGTILGEFQVVDLEGAQSDDEEDDEEDQSSYDEESYTEEDDADNDDDVDDMDYESYEEEVINDEEEDKGQGEQSWLDELQAQAGHPSWQKTSTANKSL